MVNPEKLDLDPTEYASQIENINQTYQKIKDAQELKQGKYEDALYEIEATWDEKFADSAIAFLDSAGDYVERSVECAVMGNFTDEVTILGVGIQIALGIAGWDAPCDIRDLIADIKAITESESFQWALVGAIVIDVIALIPLIGEIKYADEAVALMKAAGNAKDIENVVEGASEAAKAADKLDEMDDALDGAKKLGKGVAGSGTADDILDEGSSVVDDVVEGGLNSYDDFNSALKDITTRTDLSNEQKISRLQELFEQSNYKTDINVPSDIQYVKSIDAKGNIIYDWPPKLGFDESTVKSISRSDGLPTTWDRYGYMGGSNFADVPSSGKYTYSERAIPYVENEAAYHTGTFNNVSYFDKIDAIRKGDLDSLNTILSSEGIENVDGSYFKNLTNSYSDFIEDATDTMGTAVDATYGLKGNAAKWGDMSGGAEQYVTPLNGTIMKRLGIIN